MGCLKTWTFSLSGPWMALKRPHLGAPLSRAIVRLNTCPSATPSFSLELSLSLKKQMTAKVVKQLLIILLSIEQFELVCPTSPFQLHRLHPTLPCRLQYHLQAVLFQTHGVQAHAVGW